MKGAGVGHQLLLGAALIVLLSACQRRSDVPAPERGLPDTGASSPMDTPSAMPSMPSTPSSGPASMPGAYPGNNPGSSPWPASSASQTMP